MTEPTNQNQFDGWVFAYLDGQISPEEFHKFNRAMRDEPALMDRFIDLAMLDHSLLNTLRHTQRIQSLRQAHVESQITGVSFEAMLLALSTGSDAAEMIRLDRETQMSLGTHRKTQASTAAGWQFVGAIAAVIALVAGLSVWAFYDGKGSGVGVVQVPRDQPSDGHAVATLSADYRARWSVNGLPATIGVRDAFYAGQMVTLSEGFAQITFPSGAIAILEAPCTLELTDRDNTLRLVTGKLVGVCETPASHGFTVETPGARLIDTGTRFGVIYDGMTRTRVIEGEILVKSLSADPGVAATRLAAGDAVRIDAASGFIEKTIGLPADRFVADWSAIDNPPGIEGECRFERAMPVDLRVNQTESNLIKIYPERTAVAVGQDVSVTATQPGRYDAFLQQQSALEAGVVVDSYFIHQDTPGVRQPNLNDKPYRATIRFDRPIVGVVATSQHLTQTHGRFGLAGVAYGGQSDWPAEQADNSGLETSTVYPTIKDAFEISADRRTLTLELYGGIAIDQLRVLVQSDDGTH